MSGAITDLRSAFPEAKMIFFAGDSNFEIATMLDGPDEVIQLPTTNILEAVRRIRSFAFDIFIDFGQWPRFDALLTFASRASFTIGFQTADQHRHYGYDLPIEHSHDIHEIENYRNLLRPLGVSPCHLPRLHLRAVGDCSCSNFAVFHLWPGGRRKKLKQWPTDRWLDLLHEIAGREIEVALTGASSDSHANEAILERVSPKVRKFVRNAAGLNLRETASILSKSRLVVSVDTGIMHLAAALGVPVVALHGPTSSRRWGPVGEKTIAVDAAADGCGYLNLGWERSPKSVMCMECIPYEQVRDACHSILVAQA